MSKNENTKGAISLPQGGGAISGLGEKFSPDLFTGTGNFTIPITLPPGRNGFQPKLNLGYSSGNGNGPFGMGWALDIPGVSRKTSKGIPKYQDADTFILSGSEDLVPISKADNTTRYQPRTEGLFARIERRYDGQNDFWTVRSKSGMISIYGTSNSKGEDPATIADPKQRGNVFSWKLTQTKDSFGNRIIYTYLRDSDGSFDQLYPDEIRYVDYEKEGAEKFLVTLRFKYEDISIRYEDTTPDNRRIYPSSDCRAGFVIKTAKRCTGIEIYTNPEGVEPLTEHQLMRSYKFVYLDQLSNAEVKKEKAVLLKNGLFVLNSIQVTGHDGAKTQSLPPLKFAYSSFNPEKRKFSAVQGKELPVQSLADPNLELIDLFGNGLPDLLETKGALRYWRNLGNGTFDLPREIKDVPAGVSLSDKGVQIMDANGNGRPDLLVTEGTRSGYFPTWHDALWDPKSFKQYRYAPSFNLRDPEVQLIDLDGDGICDALRSAASFELFYNDPTEGWNHTQQIERSRLEEFPDVNFSDSRVNWADMTGDGLTNIVLVHDGNIEYWPYMGYGKWGQRIHMHNSPRFPHGYDPSRILLGDISGDGASDLIYIDNHRVILWINQNGQGWSDPIEIKGTPPLTDPAAIRLTDLNGTGTSGLLWSVQSRGTSPHYYYLDFTGATKPYLLNKMDNRMGAVTRVGYDSSITYYLKDQTSPDSRWQSTLPFPAQVVSSVEVIDQISKGKLTTCYSYHHGYWDGEEREFRGFGRVDQRDSESFEVYNNQSIDENLSFRLVDEKFYCPATETRSWFHQGPIKQKDGNWVTSDYRQEYWKGDPSKLDWMDNLSDFLKTLNPQNRRDALRTLRGSPLRSEMYALDKSPLEDRPYTVTESSYTVREESVPKSDREQSRRRIFFPLQLASRTTQWERGIDSMVQFSFTMNYDAYGQPTKIFQIACPRKWKDIADTSKNFLATCGKTKFAQSTHSQYIVDRVAETKSFEIKTEVPVSIIELKKSLENGTTNKNLIGHSLNYFDGEPYVGMEHGKLGKHGSLMRTETLVLTDDILEKVHGNTLPPHFSSDGTPQWGNEYPQKFIDKLITRNTTNEIRPELIITPLGYGFADGMIAPFEKGYYAVGQRQKLNEKGLPVSNLDPLGSQTTMEYDDFQLFPIKITDSIGLEIKAEYDYRVMQLFQMIDPNGNRSIVDFTPLGMTNSTYILGKSDEEKGDRTDQPNVLFEYDFFAFEKSTKLDNDHPQPVFVHSIQRTEHAWELIHKENRRREEINQSAMTQAEIRTFFDNEKEISPEHFIQAREYSDGFGRVIQNRLQAEEILFGDDFFGNGTLAEDQDDRIGTQKTVIGNKADSEMNVRVNGWQTFNNKGKAVEQYEPFYHAGWDYLDRSQAAGKIIGQKVTQFYDPTGEVIRTLNPDGSEQRVIHGIPKNLNNLNDFDPSPWEAYSYDTNDNAGRTHASESSSYQHHWNTPSSIKIDALGRTIESIERTKDERDSSLTEITTKWRYDILGNLLEVTDALDRLAFRYTYSLIPESAPLQIESIDGGVRKVIVNVAGQEIERRDGKGSLILQEYDELMRPIHIWARDKATDTVNLRQKWKYGDNAGIGLNPQEIKEGNFLGNLWEHYDEAGRVTVGGYDFKENPLETTRWVISDEKLLSVYEGGAANNWEITPFQVDWQQPQEEMLNSTSYKTTTKYDGLNRVTQLTYPEDVEGHRRILTPVYNRAGMLKKVQFDGEVYVENIAYNAKGQRSFIAYGNGLITRYAYDEKTFRLKRLRTEKYSKTSDLIYKPEGSPIQDFGYEYDLAGNILRIKDRVLGSGIPVTPDKLDRFFTYDPLYRLRSATGRECKQDLPSPPWLDMPGCKDTSQTRAYKRSYDYDPMGNVQQMRHHAIGSGGFQTNRTFSLQSSNNRLEHADFGGSVVNYQYDLNGNMIREGEARHFQWNHSDQLKAFRTQASSSEPSVHAQYLYDATGQRVMKWVRKQGGKLEARVYIGALFEHYRWDMETSSSKENNVLHIMDDQQRIAVLRRGQRHPDDTGPKFQLHLSDHLGSSNLVVNDNGSFTNREEHYPYGETSFGSFSKKRYRFTGKERDEESGLSYHSARYYSVWTMRWISCDPIGIGGGINLYLYASCNPTGRIDLDGKKDKEKTNEVMNFTEEEVSGIEEINFTQEEALDIKVMNFTEEEVKEKQTDTIDNLSTVQKVGSIATSEAPQDFKNAKAHNKAVKNLAEKASKYEKAASNYQELFKENRNNFLRKLEAANSYEEAGEIIMSHSKPEKLKNAEKVFDEAKNALNHASNKYLKSINPEKVAKLKSAGKILPAAGVALSLYEIGSADSLEQLQIAIADFAVSGIGAVPHPLTQTFDLSYSVTRFADDLTGNYVTDTVAHGMTLVKKRGFIKTFSSTVGNQLRKVRSGPIIYIP